MLRLVERTAATTEGKDHRHSKHIDVFINFPLSDDTAESGSQLRDEKFATHVVVVTAFDERDVFGGVVLGATEVVLDIGVFS